MFKSELFICSKERRSINEKANLESFLTRAILKESNNMLGEFI
ncbi:hypothetical protein HPHPP41_0812 [Helicobacter pylori Hp P-41]|nr:hypothetical protein HPHPP41_0812 [Helicobacter pylori Hp P-41]